uniref:CARD domain-containing protein n=1 Tax=Branchiostoma floridae TaxID=7739 RepID=C3ZRP2_BRAFL|eukprot:XP_002588831.1 hypothetical protein BRAFLDRAFT_89735 [Branchiostoma floridae]
MTCLGTANVEVSFKLAEYRRRKPGKKFLKKMITTEKVVTVPYSLNYRLQGNIVFTLQKDKGKREEKSVNVVEIYQEFGGKVVTDAGGVLLTAEGTFEATTETSQEVELKEPDPDTTMKMIHNALLLNDSAKIVEEVRDRFALSKLLKVMFSKHVISEEELKTVSDQKLSVKESVDKLVLVLENAEPEKFLMFLDILQSEGYNELVKVLDPRGIYPDNVKHISNLSGVVDHYFVTKKEREVSNSLESSRGAILHGMPGSGKTQLAIKVAGDYARMHPHAVVWLLDGSSEEKLKDGIEKLQQRLDRGANVNDISMFQSNISRWKHCLLIINDLSPTVAIPHQLMRSSAKLIITTQDSFLCHEDVRSIPQEGFTEDEAVEFLSPQMPQGTPPEHVKELANLFSCLPLGLAAARASINTGSMTVAEYKRQLRGGRAAMEALMDREDRWLQKYYKPEQQDAARNIFAALQLAIDSLDDQCSPEAEKTCKVMLQQCAFLEPNKIPVLILKAALTSSPTIGSEAHFTERMRMFSLGSIDGEGIKRRLSIHGVTQMALRLQLEKEQQTTTCINRLLQILVKFFSKDTLYAEMYKFSVSLMPHVEAALKHADNLRAVCTEYPLMKARLLMVYGHLLIQKGSPALSEECLIEAEKLLLEFARIAGHSLYNNVQNPDNVIFYTQRYRYLQELYESLAGASQSLDDNFFQETVIRRVITKEHLTAVSDKLGTDDRITVALQNMVENFEPLTVEMYETLVGTDLAIPTETLKMTFLPELYVTILYTLGKALPNKDDEDPQGSNSGHLRQALVISALSTCAKVNKAMGAMFLVYFLVMTDILGNASIVKLRGEQNSLDKQKQDMNQMIKGLTTSQCYDFGVLANLGNIIVMNYCANLMKYCTIVAENAEEVDLIPMGQRMYGKMLELVGIESKAGNTPTKLTEYYITAGEFKFMTEELEEAAEMFRKAYRVELKREEYHPSIGDALLDLIYVHIKQNELRRARVCTRRLLQLAQDHWPESVTAAEGVLKGVCCKIVFRAPKRNQEEDKSNSIKVNAVNCDRVTTV